MSYCYEIVEKKITALAIHCSEEQIAEIQNLLIEGNGGETIENDLILGYSLDIHDCRDIPTLKKANAAVHRKFKVQNLNKELNSYE